MAEAQATVEGIFREAEETLAECLITIESPKAGWNATHVFNCARKLTKSVRLVLQLAPAGPFAEKLLLARGSLLSRLTRIQRAPASLSAFLNQSHENYALMENRQMIIGESFYKEGMTVTSCLDYAAVQESLSAHQGDPKTCQKGIVALQVSNNPDGLILTNGSSLCLLFISLLLFQLLPPPLTITGPLASRRAVASRVLHRVHAITVKILPRPKEIPPYLPYGTRHFEAFFIPGYCRRYGHARGICAVGGRRTTTRRDQGEGREKKE
jgi:hypothetical protein